MEASGLHVGTLKFVPEYPRVTIMSTYKRAGFLSVEIKGKIVAAAVCGILAGAALQTSYVQAEEGTTTFVRVGDRHVCQTLNSCRGQGGCKADPNGCPGLNTCRGKGRCASPELYHSCKGQNKCKGQGGCNSEKAGRNSCKGKGGCAVPRKLKPANPVEEKHACNAQQGCGSK